MTAKVCTKVCILDFIFKNTEDDQKNVLGLLSISKNPNFITLMQELHEGFKKYYNISLEFMQRELIPPRHLNIIERISSNIMLKLIVTVNSSSSRLSEILILDFKDAIKEIAVLKNSYLESLEDRHYLIDNRILNLIDEYTDFLYSSIYKLHMFL